MILNPTCRFFKTILLLVHFPFDILDDKLPTAGVSGGTVGPNELALRPTITKAKVSGAVGAITGTASPNSTIELFVADPSSSGYGSGKIY